MRDTKRSGWRLRLARSRGLLPLLVAVTLLAIGCQKRVRPPLENRGQALRLAVPPRLADDLDLATLAPALRLHVKRMREYRPYPHPLVFGNRQLSPREYTMGLEYLAELIESETNDADLERKILEAFEFYEIYGTQDWGDVFMTSYYEPVIPGSRRRTDEHPSPLLKKPDDLIEVALDLFDARFKDIRRMRGRLIKERSLSGNRVMVPYYSRQEIEQDGALSNRRLELAWVDPIDNFFLQVQGSGTVQFDDGRELRVGYAEQNGHLYHSIGKFVSDVIPLEKLTLLNLEAHLRTLSPEDRMRVLFENPSYVFFRKLDGKPVTSLGTEVVEGRTIATDPKFFPKGGLAFLKFEAPRFVGPILTEPADWRPVSRFVLDQDTGGAIRGGGRLDLFWGKGEEAKRHAAVIKQTGKLYYLAPKESFLADMERLLSPEPTLPEGTLPGNATPDGASPAGPSPG